MLGNTWLWWLSAFAIPHTWLWWLSALVFYLLVQIFHRLNPDLIQLYWAVVRKYSCLIESIHWMKHLLLEYFSLIIVVTCDMYFLIYKLNCLFAGDSVVSNWWTAPSDDFPARQTRPLIWLVRIFLSITIKTVVWSIMFQILQFQRQSCLCWSIDRWLVMSNHYSMFCRSHENCCINCLYSTFLLDIFLLQFHNCLFWQNSRYGLNNKRFFSAIFSFYQISSRTMFTKLKFTMCVCYGEWRHLST